VVSGYTANPYADVLPAQAVALQGAYRLSYRKRVSGMTVFLLLRRPAQAGTARATLRSA
jgi:hypothetical protein